MTGEQEPGWEPSPDNKQNMCVKLKGGRAWGEERKGMENRRGEGMWGRGVQIGVLF